MKAVLLLEDGTTFEGTAFGAEGSVVGEVVFNTSMTGYQEIITDPSSYGQIVMMTYPLIGNCGTNNEDGGMLPPQLNGFIVRELCDSPNNWRSTGNLHDYLAKHGVTGIEGIDTRALTRLLREKGTMNGLISTNLPFNLNESLQRIKEYQVINPALQERTKKPIHYEGSGNRVVLIDLGDTEKTIHALKKRGCEMNVFPYCSTAKEILSINPDGIVISNGPGDPTECINTIELIRALPVQKPVFGIGLGHQVIALAFGAKTIRLKYGHRGSNHPVKDTKTEITHITTQNHGYIIDADSIVQGEMEITHINMNDGTIEGLRYLNRPIQTVQFHPEGMVETNDTGFFYDDFLECMKSRGNV